MSNIFFFFLRSYLLLRSYVFSYVCSLCLTRFPFTKFQSIGSDKKVTFLPTWLLKTVVNDRRRGSRAAERQKRYCIIEQRLYGNFRKFNCNTGVITEYVAILEAFAHYTYQATKHYLVVTDLQGVEYDNEFCLTDPAIHCVDNLRFGRTNFGSRGIDELFVANHFCNSVCRSKGLSPIKH